MTRTETLSETRRKAWETRRQKYGSRGHNGTYQRGPSRMVEDNARMRQALIRLHIEGVLSEGQTATITGLDRLEVRRLAGQLIAEEANDGE